eukprot:GSMAST32.ASY1.ANO1.1522.1 assembled CDS
MDRCKGGLFTSLIDENPTDTQFEVPTGLTDVKILDYDFVQFINFEAEINYPENDDIVQVENFGMHLNVDGTIVYGIFVEAILDRKKDDISLDLLSRLLVDLHQDSSRIMNDLLSQYQSELLNMLFLGESQTQKISPKIDGEDYMDKGDLENELKQILGDLRACHDLGDKDVIMMGQDGVLLCGPHCMQHENILDKLNSASCDVILLREILEYLSDSLQDLTIPDIPEDLNGKRLFKVLEPAEMKRDIGEQHQLLTLQQMTDVINTKQLEAIFSDVENNVCFIFFQIQKTSISLQVLQMIVAGSFAFDIIDRLSGGTLNITVPKWVDDMFVNDIIRIPGLWFVFIVNFKFIYFSYEILYLTIFFEIFFHNTFTVNKKIDTTALKTLIDKKIVKCIETNHEINKKHKKVQWQEIDSSLWVGILPKVEIIYDEVHNWLLSVRFQN